MEFSAGSSIRFGWETFKKRGWFLIGAMVLYIIVDILINTLGRSLGTQGFGEFVATFVSWVLSIFLSMGLTAFMLKAHDNIETAELADLWHPQQFLQYLIASILVFLAVGIGFILLIVPGVILSLMFVFTPYIVIDRNMGAIPAMKESARIAYGHKWQLLGFLVLLALISLLGAICLVVGLFVAIPVVSLATVHAYRTLSQGANEPAAA